MSIELKPDLFDMETRQSAITLPKIAWAILEQVAKKTGVDLAAILGELVDEGMNKRVLIVRASVRPVQEPADEPERDLSNVPDLDPDENAFAAPGGGQA